MAKEKTQKKRRRKPKDGDKKKNLPFLIVTSLLGVSVLIPVVMFVVSLLLHKEVNENFTKSLYPIKYESYVEKYAEEFNVDVCLVYGIMRTESSFDPNVVSNAGAIGLMQIMPETFEWLQNYRADFEPDKLMKSDKLYDPKINIEYGTYFISYLLDRYGGDTTLAVCAYNAGYGNVDSWIADGTIPDGNVTPESVPFEETSNYLSRVTESMEVYRELYFSMMESYPDGTSRVVSDKNGGASSGVSDESSEVINSDDSYSDQTYIGENVDNNNDLYYNDDDNYYDYEYEYDY